MNTVRPCIDIKKVLVDFENCIRITYSPTGHTLYMMYPKLLNILILDKDSKKKSIEQDFIKLNLLFYCA